MSAAVSPEDTAGGFLEDYFVGDALVSEPFTFTRELVSGYANLVDDHVAVHDPDVPGASVHGSLIIGSVIAWLVQSGSVAQVRAELDHTWHYEAPVRIGQSVTFRMTITRVVRTPGLNNGIVHRTLEVFDEDGHVLQHATSRILVKARETIDDSAARVATALGTKPWVALFAEQLAMDNEFVRMTSTWDGSIALAFGETAIQFRIYKGQLLEATHRTPHGPTFTVHASEKTWVDLVTGESNDFTRRAMAGEVSMTGNAYEYLRLNRTVVAMVDVMRQIVEKEK